MPTFGRKAPTNGSEPPLHSKEEKVPFYQKLKKKMGRGKNKEEMPEKKEKKKRSRKNKNNAEEQENVVMDKVEQEQEHPLETLCRELLQREEQVMTSGGLSEDNQNQLSQDLDQLWTQIQLEVQNTFSPGFRGEALRAAVRCVLKQEDMDQRWSCLDSGLAPAWRSKKALQIHNELLENMVQARLTQRPLQDGATEQVQVTEVDAEQEPLKGSDQESVNVSSEVRWMGEQMRQDLLHIGRRVVPCYPEQWDILNTYVKLYHCCFSSRLEQLAASSLDDSALYSLLDCVRHRDRNIPVELLDKVNTDSLGPLLPPDVLQKLQEQCLDIAKNTTQMWLERALKIEVESWDKGLSQTQDTSYCHSPLASDVLQVLHAFLLRVNSTGTDQSQQSFSVHLESFLSSYVKAVKEFVNGSHSNVPSVLKAQLVCEEQFREFVVKQHMDEKKKESCLESLDALRDCGYCSLTSGICTKLKKQLCGLWTEQWLERSLSVADSLCDFLDQELEQLSDLKPSCSQWILGRLHRDVAVRYYTNLLKTTRRSQSQQVTGATRMKEDIDKINDFFTERATLWPQGSSGQDCETKDSGSRWVTMILSHVSEVLRLKEPDSVKLELGTLVKFCPDLRSLDICRLLMLKAGFSSASIRSIKQSVELNRPREPSANHCPPFFSLLKAPTMLQSVCLWVQLNFSTCCC